MRSCGCCGVGDGDGAGAGVGPFPPLFALSLHAPSMTKVTNKMVIALILIVFVQVNENLEINMTLSLKSTLSIQYIVASGPNYPCTFKSTAESQEMFFKSVL